MDPTFEYMTGQLRDEHATLLAGFQQASDEAAATLHPARDVPYGPHPRERFDVFHASGPWRGTVTYFHAGYWQSRDKSQFRFLAHSVVLRHGLDLALVNYPLCPDVTLPALLDSTRRAIPAVLRHAGDAGRGSTRLLAAGHSAGAHIAVELALTDWHAQGLAASPISGIAALSGVYDLAPLLQTPLNDKLRLDLAMARAMPPLMRVRPAMPPACFAVGATETNAFRAQTQAMCNAWTEAGNVAEALVIENADHFSLLESDLLWAKVSALL